MTDQEDGQSHDLAIAASLEANGITLKARSRALAALDRLAGSLFDMPTAYFEGVAGKKRLKDAVEERLTLAQAKAAEQQILGDPELGNILIRDVLKDRARKQVNTSGVAVEAIEAIRALPPPEPEASSEKISENLNEDWMNQFVRYAEDASSEDLQQIWGRVLAGEIRQPGSFSKQTLRFIAELDKETAKACEFVAGHVIDTWIPTSEFWNRGDPLLYILELKQLGLIEGGGMLGLAKHYDLDHAGRSIVTNKQLALVFRGSPELPCDLTPFF
jgi:Protein of unknown function (DUF2806)